MKLFKRILRFFFWCLATGSSVYVFFISPEIRLTLITAMVIYIAVWAFSKDEV